MSVGNDLICGSSISTPYSPEKNIVYGHLCSEEMVQQLPQLTTFVHKYAAKKYGISRQDFAKEEKVISALNDYMKQLVTKIQEADGHCVVAANLQKKKFVGIFMGCAFEKSAKGRWKYYQGYPVGPKLLHQHLLSSYKSIEIQNELRNFVKKTLIKENCYLGLVYGIYHDDETLNLATYDRLTKVESKLISKEEGYETLILETPPKNKMIVLKVMEITKKILEFEDISSRSKNASILRVMSQIDILQLYDQLWSIYRETELNQFFRNKLLETKEDILAYRKQQSLKPHSTYLEKRMQDYDELVLEKLEHIRARIQISDLQFWATKINKFNEAKSAKCLAVIASMYTVENGIKGLVINQIEEKITLSKPLN